MAICATPLTHSRANPRALLQQQSVVATTDETLAVIEREQFQDSDCGAVDMSLLASVLLTPEAVLWTIDKKLDALAARLGVAFSAAAH
jgi:hypothetical protein